MPKSVGKYIYVHPGIRISIIISVNYRLLNLSVKKQFASNKYTRGNILFLSEITGWIFCKIHVCPPHYGKLALEDSLVSTEVS